MKFHNVRILTLLRCVLPLSHSAVLSQVNPNLIVVSTRCPEALLNLLRLFGKLKIRVLVP